MNDFDNALVHLPFAALPATAPVPVMPAKNITWGTVLTEMSEAPGVYIISFKEFPAGFPVTPDVLKTTLENLHVDFKKDKILREKVAPLAMRETKIVYVGNTIKALRWRVANVLQLKAPHTFNNRYLAMTAIKWEFLVHWIPLGRPAKFFAPALEGLYIELFQSIHGTLPLGNALGFE